MAEDLIHGLALGERFKFGHQSFEFAPRIASKILGCKLWRRRIRDRLDLDDVQIPAPGMQPDHASVAKQGRIILRALLHVQLSWSTSPVTGRLRLDDTIVTEFGQQVAMRLPVGTIAVVPKARVSCYNSPSAFCLRYLMGRAGPHA